MDYEQVSKNVVPYVQRECKTLYSKLSMTDGMNYYALKEQCYRKNISEPCRIYLCTAILQGYGNNVTSAAKTSSCHKNPICIHFV